MKNLLTLFLVMLVTYLTSFAQSSTTSNLTKGLVAHYPLDANANDMSGNNNHGTVNGATLSAGVKNEVNGAYCFDGINDYINTPLKQNSVSSYSISVWVKTNLSQTTGGNSFAVVQTRGPLNQSGKSLTLGYSANSGQWFYTMDTDNVIVGTGKTMNNNNQWMHIVGTWSGVVGSMVASNQFKLYINGTLQSSTAYGSNYTILAPVSGLGTTKIGYHEAWNSYFNGCIDNVRIYNRSLTNNEVQELYQKDTFVPTLGLSLSNLQVADAQGQGNVYVTSNTIWNVKSDVAWLVPKIISGSGNQTLYFDYQANSMTIARTGKLIFQIGALTKELTVTQAATKVTPYLNISSTALFLEASANETTIDVNANTDWVVSSSATWLIPKSLSGTGDFKNMIDCQENKTPTSRTAKLIFKASDITKEINVTQDGASILLEVSSVNDFSSTRSTQNLKISSNTSWKITQATPNTWLSVSPMSGTGDAIIPLIASENYVYDARKADLVIQAGGISKTITIKQQGIPIPYFTCTDNLEPNNTKENATNFSGNYYRVEEVCLTENDEDWFKFPFDKTFFYIRVKGANSQVTGRYLFKVFLNGSRANITTEPSPLPNYKFTPPLDTYLELYAADGSLIASNDNDTQNNWIFARILDFDLGNYRNMVCPSPFSADVTVSTTETTAEFIWKPLNGVASFTFEYKPQNETDWIIQTVANPKVSLTGLTPNSYYVYRIKGNCTNGLPSANNFMLGFATKRAVNPIFTVERPFVETYSKAGSPTVPVSSTVPWIATDVNGGFFSISTQMISSENGQDGKVIISTQENTSPNERRGTFIIRPQNANLSPVMVEVIQKGSTVVPNTTCEAPINLIHSVFQNDQATIAWDDVKDVSYYEVYAKFNGVDYTFLQNTADSQITRSITPDNTFCFKVVAVCNNGVKSPETTPYCFDSHLVVYPNKKDVPNTAGTFEITLDASDKWTAKTNASWLSVSPSSGNAGKGQKLIVSYSTYGSSSGRVEQSRTTDISVQTTKAALASAKITQISGTLSEQNRMGNLHFDDVDLTRQDRGIVVYSRNKGKEDSEVVFIIDMSKGASIDFGIVRSEYGDGCFVKSLSSNCLPNGLFDKKTLDQIYSDEFRRKGNKNVVAVVNGQFMKETESKDIWDNKTITPTTLSYPVKINGQYASDTIYLLNRNGNPIRRQRYFQKLGINGKKAFIDSVFNNPNENMDVLRGEYGNTYSMSSTSLIYPTPTYQISSPNGIVGQFISVSKDGNDLLGSLDPYEIDYNDNDDITAIGVADGNDNSGYNKIVVYTGRNNRFALGGIWQALGVPYSFSGDEEEGRNVGNNTRIVQLDGGSSSQAFGIQKNGTNNWYKKSDRNRQLPQYISILAANVSTSNGRQAATDSMGTAAFSIEPLVKEEGVFNIYPNPNTDGLVTVAYSLPAEVANEEVNVFVHSLTGQLVHQQKVSYSTDGKAELNLSKLGMGSYTVTLQAGAYSLSKNLILQK